jgi:two-component system sensor histidine kinase KdpD
VAIDRQESGTALYNGLHDTPPRRGGVIVGVGGTPDNQELVERASELAGALGLPWEAVHIEAPGADRQSGSSLSASEGLQFAASMGATVSAITAAGVADGLLAHAAASSARHLVIGTTRKKAYRAWQDSLAEALLKRSATLALHVYPVTQREHLASSPGGATGESPVGAAPYLLSIAAVVATAAVAAVFRLFVPARSLDLLFLFPVIAAAARLGLLPALLSALLSVLAYNYFFLAPGFEFDTGAPQNLIMIAVLCGVALYTSAITAKLRQRVLLSDRSAQENAELAAFGQRLARDSDWAATAKTICDQVGSMLDVHVAVFREVEGELVLVGSSLENPQFGPINRTALEWSWKNGQVAGAGTPLLGAADWQFRPLATSLGVLAILALARHDGRNPVRAEQELLLSTLISQAALAHERLRLQESAS